MVEHITNDKFDSDVLQSEKAVIVDFYADWCGPCKRLAPIFSELSEEMDSVKFLKVNVEDESELAGKYAVQSIPTLIIFKDGEPVERIMGLMPKDELKKTIESKQ
jgi:thioredoxin 1